MKRISIQNTDKEMAISLSVWKRSAILLCHVWMRTLSKPMILRTSGHLRIEENLTSTGGLMKKLRFLISDPEFRDEVQHPCRFDIGR
jgi:hypothetical protein